MDDVEYIKAQEIISRGLSGLNLSTKNRVDLYWLQGICLISSDLVNSAKASFLKLLALEPMFEPGLNMSPKILSAFLDAKNQFLKAGGSDALYQPKMSPIEDTQKGKKQVIRFNIENLERVDDILRVVLYMRKQGNSAYTSFDLSRDVEIKGLYLGNLASEVLNHNQDSYAVEYYIEALSRDSTRLTGIGHHESPLTLAIMPNGKNTIAPQLISSSQTLYWPHWLGIGTMVLGGIVLGIVSFSSPPENSLKITVTQATGLTP